MLYIHAFALYLVIVVMYNCFISTFLIMSTIILLQVLETSTIFCQHIYEGCLERAARLGFFSALN